MRPAEQRASARERPARRMLLGLGALALAALAVAVWVASVGAEFGLVDPAPAEAVGSRTALADRIDAELAGLGLGAVPDGALYALVLSSELLGGAGDPRGVDTWSTSGYASPEAFSDWITAYVTRGQREGYLARDPELVDLLLAAAAAVRDAPAPGAVHHELPSPETQLARETMASIVSELQHEHGDRWWDSPGEPEPELAAMIRATVQDLDDEAVMRLFELTAAALDEGYLGQAAHWLDQLRDELRTT